MQPADDIKRVFKDAELTVRTAPDDQVFAEMAQAQEQQILSPRTLSDRWRRTMKNPVTKLAIAAVILCVCLFGGLLWQGTGSSVALADVLAQIQQVQAYFYQMSSSSTMTKHLKVFLLSTKHRLSILKHLI